MPRGHYFFTAKADDGVRLFVNGRPLIDAWIDQGPTDYSASYAHKGGTLDIRVEYYQGGGGKTLQLTMRDHDFYGEYYRGVMLNKVPPGSTARRIAPIAYRYESDIDFDFGHGSYLERVGANDFSARWMGRVSLPVGRWRIDATADDGIRVYIDGRLLIDSWQAQSATTHSRQIDLTGREHDVKVEYFEQTGAGVCRVNYVRVV
ncbi:MAG: PA14 domain-containing protein [Vicinamibacterales bacterium]